MNKSGLFILLSILTILFLFSTYTLTGCKGCEAEEIDEEVKKEIITDTKEDVEEDSPEGEPAVEETEEEIAEEAEEEPQEEVRTTLLWIIFCCQTSLRDNTL